MKQTKFKDIALGKYFYLSDLANFVLVKISEDRAEVVGEGYSVKILKDHCVIEKPEVSNKSEL